MTARRAPGDRSGRQAGFHAYLAELAARPGRLVAAVMVTLMAVPVLRVASQSASAAPRHDPSRHAVRPTSAAAPATAPADPTVTLLRAAASTCRGLDWSVLAGIYAVESSSGRSRRSSSVGAVGPMQFLPATWREYGADADGDGDADVRSLSDAALGTARMLCSNGGGTPSGLRQALYSYNHSWGYVDRVEEAAQAARSSPESRGRDQDRLEVHDERSSVVVDGPSDGI